jgi:flagellar biosynthesis/type III secretory pathway protein FliH
MPYVTSAERIGIEKGRLEGRSEGMDKGQLNEAREMVLEALDTKFSSNVPADIHKLIKDLNNRLMLRKLHKSTIQSKDIDDFRKTLEELTAEDPV